jgi:sulfur-oxidizing protein SoxY
MSVSRRSFLRWSLGALAASVGSLLPWRVFAEWKASAFTAREVKTALAELGIGSYAESPQVILKTPDIAENGAVVPIEVTSLLAGTTEIIILGEKNLQPLIARYVLSPGLAPEVGLKIKMAETSKVRAIVRTAGGYFSAAREVKITIGGCGG